MRRPAPLLLLLVLPFSARAADLHLPAQAGSWRQSSQPHLTIFAPNSAVASVPGAALLQESGALAEEQATYQRSGARQPQSIAVSLYRFGDPSGAYEFYTSLLEPGQTALDIGDGSASTKNGLRAIVGNFVLRVDATGGPAAELAASIASSISKVADGTPLPPVRTYMPLAGLVHGTQRYALGPAGFAAAAESLGVPAYGRVSREVGFALGAEAMLAKYSNGRDVGVLLILSYPTPQLAEQHLHHLQSVLPEANGTDALQIERRGSLLAMVLPPVNAEYAASLRDSIRYQTAVTWNEPAQSATDPPWLVIVGRLFLGTAIFCLLAIGLGIAFGAVRIVTKIFFPGKVFDRPERMEILQLGLSGKRIDTKDFY